MAESRADSRDGVVVVYALPDRQMLVDVGYRAGITAAQAVALSGLAARFPDIRKHELVLGLFGRRIEPDCGLAPGDRVEICRPLQCDPREQRRYMTSTGRVMGQRDDDAPDAG